MKHYHKTRDEMFEKVAGSKTSAFVPKTDVAGSGSSDNPLAVKQLRA